MARPKHIETPVEKVQRIRFLILVRAGRTALGLSQRELSSIVGVHFSTLARFESGHLRLKQDHIQRILSYFEQAGISFEGMDKGDIRIQLSGENIDNLAHVGHMRDQIDQEPRFRL